MRLQRHLADAAATDRLGIALARSCPWSEREVRSLWLQGELGAGKTTLAAALLAALGVTEPVRSPSYALLELYPLAAGLAVHLDLYRLQAADELHTLGLRDYLSGGTLLLIEWPERAGRALPPADLQLQLHCSAQGRDVELQALSPAGEDWLQGARSELATRSRVSF